MSSVEAIEIFLLEAKDLLEQIEQGLLDLETRLDDRQLVDSVFRSLHTLKGSGAMFGFNALADFTHHCETAFDRVRKGEAAATGELVAAILAAQDHMRALVAHPDADHGDTGAVLLAGLEAAVSGGGQPAPAADAPSAAQTWIVRFALPADALANGVNPMGLLNELRDLGACKVVGSTDDVPPLDELDPTRCHLSWTVTLTTDQPRAAIEDVFIFVMDDMKLEIEAVGEAPPEPAAGPAAVAETAAQAGDPARPGADNAPLRAGESVRVPAERLDELMDRVGELVIAQSRLKQLAASSVDLQLRSVSEEIDRLTGELRDTTMVLRMVPVGSLFGRFRRLVHDLGRDTGKQIELSCEGESTEVDKTVVERLADPLVHLVRNAADHGLETPQERQAAGKPQAGTMRLSARQSGGEVIISVKDDGRGIDRDRVRARAESHGLLEAGAQISDAELLQMIFQPGFSTAQQVTSLSGRGVGMDVVKRTVEALRGSIDVVSRPGEGSEFSLRIPLTLAIIDGLLVRVGQGRYVIPLAAVEECLELSLDEDLRSRGRSFISLRDSLVPFLRLRELFDTGTPPELHQKVVVVSTGGERVGLVVDQIIGDHQTVIKSLSKLHAEVATFSGATILGDGAVALILDVPHLVTAGQRQEAQMRAAG
jgi:two-component system, chemotaxis family, sensor kinase CheA